MAGNFIELICPTVAKAAVGLFVFHLLLMKPRTIINKEARTGPEVRFALTAENFPFKAVQETEFEKLKSRLLQTALMEADQADLYAPLRRAANEAAALAWNLEFPVLLLPELFAEKVLITTRQVEKQRVIRSQTESLVRAA